MVNRLSIQCGGLEHPQVAELLQQHHQSMRTLSPEESVHALDVDKLKEPNVTFWTAWFGSELAGCGALQKLDSKHAELKSMRTSPKHLRKGIAAKLLEQILQFAITEGYQQVCLETGTADAFKPAQQLYQCFGFEYCPPFADYQLDPYSTFMSKHLV